MPDDPRLPPGTTSVDPRSESDSAEPARFVRWAESAENFEEADALIAGFLADHGVEMMAELVACSGSLHRTAQEYLGKLEERYQRWWERGRPRLMSSPKISVKYSVPAAERQAHEYLEANLPPGAMYWVGRRMRRGTSGGGTDARSQMVDWVCRVEDGAATSGAVGPTAIEAAERAVAAWRQFVTGSGVELGLVDSVAGDEMEEGSKPPALQAPSSSGSSQSKDEKRVS
jgi:hypothetical protein